MENMEKAVPKWVLIVWPKIPQMRQNLSAQFVCPSPKVLDFNPRYSTTDHWIQESLKRKFNCGLFWAVGATEIKNQNCHKHATFEISF